MEKEYLRSGKAKDIYRRRDGYIEFVFTDRVTAFDGKKKAVFPHKGEICCKLSCFWFEKLGENGIKTHFRGYIPPNAMLAEELSLLPVEVIARNYLYGSLWRRYQRGEVDLNGFIREGVAAEPLTVPFLEFTTKFEPIDRPVTEEEILSQSWMTLNELEYIRDVTVRVGEIMSAYIEPRGLILADYKLEYGRSGRREVVLADEVGTPDVCRFWDKEAYDRGEIVSLDKDVFREGKGDLLQAYTEVYRRILSHD